MPQACTQRSDRYYSLSGTRYAVLEACKKLRQRVADGRDVAGAKAIAAGYVKTWAHCEGTDGALERLFPELFSD